MEIPIESELVMICREIKDKALSIEQWSEIESDDLFQTSQYTGGFDADEKEFCFSYFSDDVEYWFQLDLKLAQKISEGFEPKIQGRRAE